MPDAVVIGAGPNGLVAGNLLADAGWEVVVLEAQEVPGGAVRSADYLGVGYVADMCSAFYPLAAASPVIAGLHLEEFGLTWCHAPAVLAHARAGRRPAMLWRDEERTAARLEEEAPGDGRAWHGLLERFLELEQDLYGCLFTPFPPLRSGARLLRQLGAGGALRFARFGLLPVRRLAEEEFLGEEAALLLAGCALHADLGPEGAGSGLFGWLLSMLGQRYGFPVPKGGAQALTDALVRRLLAKGGQLRCGEAVRSVRVDAARASGVVTAAGEFVHARRAVLADVSAPQLYGGLVAWSDLPASLRGEMRRFQWDFSTFKLDWSLSGPVPWADPEVAEAGTVHLADDLGELTQFHADLSRQLVPARPFLLLGQANKADPTRSPPGTEVVWAYTHVPRRAGGDAGGGGISGQWDEPEKAAFAARIEERIERVAPGFGARVTHRKVLAPADLEAHDANLVNGAINGGTSSIHQQLVFRPLAGLGRPETPVEALYLASASAHPGGGVHGGCGANAARAALAAERPLGRLVGRPLLRATRRRLEGETR